MSDALPLLLIGGGLALSLPHVTPSSRDRWWHAWVATGLLPLLVGLACGPALGPDVFGQLGWHGLSLTTAQALQPFLAVVLTTAGVLVGTQLRPAGLLAAGGAFLTRIGGGAAMTFALVAVITAAVAVPLTGSWAAVAVAGLIGACAVATAERVPGGAAKRDRQLVRFGHVVPAGLWNLLAIAGGALALGIGDRPAQGWWGLLLALLLPSGLGLLLGLSAAAARTRAEAFLVLPAVIALAGGLALALGSAPLLTGLVVGAVLATVGRGRAALVERSISDLEQPLAIAAGLLAGLSLEPAAYHPMVWCAALVVPLRWLARGYLSPSHPDLIRLRDRRNAPTGATGVLLLAAATLAPAPLPALVLPLTAALALATLVADAAERRP